MVFVPSFVITEVTIQNSVPSPDYQDSNEPAGQIL